MKFSGHESFPCRYTWLPKAFLAIETDSKIFSDEEQAMVTLGVGKNMVRSIRFWVQVAGIAEPAQGGGLHITKFGRQLLSPGGFDPFLEDIRTLWLLHWKISTYISDPLFAWDYLLNRWQHPEINRTEVVTAFQHEANKLERKLATRTLEQHFDIFLHTYVPTRSRKGEILEDNLDCPLVELELIQKTGERKLDGSGKRENIYAFRREEKIDITPELFIYCLNDFWNTRFPSEKTLSFRDISVGHCSPGQVFKIPEGDIRCRLDIIEANSSGLFSYKDSASLQFVSREEAPSRDLLAEIYATEGCYV